MTIREREQAMEHTMLCEYATYSDQSRGRLIAEEPCPLRLCFQRDRDRIIHCKSFRKLKQKTQVFLSLEGDGYHTRLTHTLEVSQIARTLARALRLNETLTEAIALGHDLGHTPFGHAGERALNAQNPVGFAHYSQSVRVVRQLEKEGKGLNLSWEVLNGIVCHTKGTMPATREGCVVRYADRIAYINHDIEDAITVGALTAQDIPVEISRVLGATKSQRISTLLMDIVEQGAQTIHMSKDIANAYEALHTFLYEHVYTHPMTQENDQKAEKVVTELYQYFVNNADAMPLFYQQIAAKQGVDRAVTDYISGMSDEFATHTFEQIFVPQRWHV